MSEAALLRALADKLDALEAVTTYPAEVTDPGEVVVSWSEQDDHPGYGPLSEAIGMLVAQHWNALRSQVVKQCESDVQSARAVLMGGSSLPDRPSTISAGLESPIRKVAG